MPKERAEGTAALPAAVVAYLEGIRYPCTRAEMVEHAAARGAPHMVIEALEQMPEEQYYDLTHVVGRFSRVNP